MKICLKELRESMVWLKIIERKPMLPADRLGPILQECDELVSIFVKSIQTADSSKPRSIEYSTRAPANGATEPLILTGNTRLLILE
jgi:hypothetical protein